MQDHRDSPWRRARLRAWLCALASWFLLTSFHGASPPSCSGAGSNTRAAAATTAALRPAQLARQPQLAKGKLLVANRDLGDPNFARTVVLLIDYNDQGAMGVIINRATRVKLSDLLPRIESLQGRPDPIYEGGPVERAEILMLVRSPKEPEDSTLLFDNVYLSISADLLKRLAGQPPQDDISFRVFSGYAGWGPEQLDTEVEMGSWHILPATTGAVFAPNPEAIWQDLIDRTTLRFAFSLNRRMPVSGGLAAPLAAPRRWAF